MREIIMDTETTGMRPESGDRIVEIGGVVCENHLPTGEIYHVYINPEREVPEGAYNVHGLSSDFLADYPVFEKIADEFLSFIKDAPLVFHNAPFDMKFINFELKKCGRPPISMDRVVDTLPMARRKYPGAQNSLDALCRRFNVDNSNRTKHGALLDSELLAEVYLELIGGREPGLGIAAINQKGEETDNTRFGHKEEKPVRPPRPHAPKSIEEKAHADFLEKLKNPLWGSF